MKTFLKPCQRTASRSCRYIKRRAWSFLWRSWTLARTSEPTTAPSAETGSRRLVIPLIGWRTNSVSFRRSARLRDHSLTGRLMTCSDCTSSLSVERWTCFCWSERPQFAMALRTSRPVGTGRNLHWGRRSAEPGASVTTLSRARTPYLIPSYSLTGDLLAYQKCGLQYRYQNRGALPPSVPVQLWFGEFIHALMEEAFRRWRADATYQTFPWDWSQQVRPIELEIYQRLASRTMPAPPNLFCPFDGQDGCVNCGHAEHKLIASRRADALLRTWAPHLFPLVAEPRYAFERSDRCRLRASVPIITK